MKALRCAIVLSVVVVVSPAALFAGTIKATAVPTGASLVRGQQVTVPVVIDVSDLPERLGSYTAWLRWDPGVLEYVSHSAGTTAGFGQPVVNTAKVSDGELVFAAAHPHGAEGEVHVLNGVFKVIGSEGSDCSLELGFTAMAAALTFSDLLPYVESVVTGVEGAMRVEELPQEYALLANHPNPFNPCTEIGYRLPRGGHVWLSIYNVVGQELRVLVDEEKPAGNHVVAWDGTDASGRKVPAGIYVYSLRAGSFTDSRKMLLVK